jgi:hypothetical protein
MARPNINVQNAKDYSRGFNGTALKVTFVRGDINPGSPIDAKNIAARGNNFSWNIPTPVTQADEINSVRVNETNHGRQELGTGRIDVVYNLKASDQMPTSRTIRTDEEYTVFELTGDDHPMTVNGVPTILSVFLGARIVNHGSNTGVNQQKMVNVDIIFRDRYTGAEWKELAGDSVNYPAAVSAG